MSEGCSSCLLLASPSLWLQRWLILMWLLLHGQQKQCFQAFTVEQAPAVFPESSPLQEPDLDSRGTLPFHWMRHPPQSEQQRLPVSNSSSRTALSVEAQLRGLGTRLPAAQRYVGHHSFKSHFPDFDTMYSSSWFRSSREADRNRLIQSLLFAGHAPWRLNYWGLVTIHTKKKYTSIIFKTPLCGNYSVTH